MSTTVGYRWRLRELMAARGMFATTDLHPHLAERGVELSAIQVYRLVAQIPERLNLRILAALCDILDCTPADLIEPYVESARGKARKTAGGIQPSGSTPTELRPTRARIVPDKP
ncbi:helix-turn-helix domain-containing protein [Amycolatopsis sp. NPDC049868]|uniref:helix-turn-helix domain-containing protein n=1 Tax=Amycolatopsis sp. NPDC049868 TaxID=3363934 RepID=UPI00379ADA43